MQYKILVPLLQNLKEHTYTVYDELNGYNIIQGLDIRASLLLLIMLLCADLAERYGCNPIYLIPCLNP